MKRKGLVTGLGLIACCSILFSVSASLMWFDNRTRIAPNQIVGSSNGAYYASGDGSKDDPFVINQPRHLYNLAWLQYLGAYNQEEDGTVKEVYFRVEGNSTNEGGDSILDMDGWTLPPIGTKENPFVGNFNGNDTIIKNLTVSNTFSDYGDAHPYYNGDGKEMTKDNFVQPKIIGFFGVVGALDTKNYEYTTNIAIEGASYTDANLVYDTYVDNITIQNKTSNQELLAGLLAGYVNAPIRQCGVGYGEFSFASGTKNLSTSNTPSGATIKGVSNYSLIGAYNPSKFSYKGLPGTDGGSGSASGWGGSIDMRMLNKRLTYINATGTFTVDTSSTLISKGKGEIQASLSRGRCWTTKEYYWNASYSDSYHTMYLLDGTCLPLNVDEDAMGLVNNQETEFSKTINGYSHKLHSNATYLSDDLISESVLKSNTGYLVSAGTSTSDSIIRAGYRQFDESTYYSGIPDSFIDTYQITYDEDHKKQFAMFTIKNNTTYRILDDVNGNSYSSGNENKTYSELDLVKYKEVRSNFDIAMDGAQVYNGFHFQQYLPEAITTNAANLSSFITKQNVKILSDDIINDYELIKGGLNFTVENDGFITTIVGAGYNSSGGGHSLFDLYKIDRDENTHVINSLTRIEKIYVKTDNDNSITDIAYNTQPSTAYTEAINLYSLATSDKLTKDAAYYFEVPVEKGDYLIGTATNSSQNNAYLLYLDIGANGSDSSEKTKSPTEIDFVYYGSDKKLVKITSDGTYVNSEVVFQIDSGASGSIAFKRTYTEGTSIVYYYIPTASSINITAIGTDGKSSQSDSELAEN